MFAPRTPESFLSRAITAEVFAERHQRAGNRVMARLWRRQSDHFRDTALKLSIGGRVAEMAVYGGAL